MFTGIIEAVGEVARRAQDRLVVNCSLGGIRPGDSIAVDGCCLTAVKSGSGKIEVQLLRETTRRTTLGDLPPGRRVNLERPLPATGRLGGHFVTGHVDGVGAVTGRRRDAADDVIEVRAPALIMAHIVPKGCIAVDGVSLTVVEVREDRFTFHLIEHTRKHTTLAGKRAGDRVNLEADVLAKYVGKFAAGRGGLTEEKLRSQGAID